jgi:predicted GH43/DUF377 family glycosyl hydrolase
MQPEMTPAIADQTPWPCGFFDLTGIQADRVEYYNPGLVEQAGARWLVLRRVTNSLKPGIPAVSDFVVSKLNGLELEPELHIELLKQHPGQQYEDPRVIANQDNIYLGYTTCVRCKGEVNSWGHTSLAVLDHHWRLVFTHEPDYGGNQPNWIRNTRCEKNWVWFFHHDNLWMVYRAEPHTVVGFGPKMLALGEFITRTKLGWQYGEVRGGTPPIRVGDEYWTMFHSSVGTLHPKVYYMGAYAFSANPPFYVTRITCQPLLSGNSRDNLIPGRSWVIFPCGALLQNGEWLVTLGVNDRAAWIKIPHSELVKLTRPL